jgi:hypothetical protein
VGILPDFVKGTEDSGSRCRMRVFHTGAVPIMLGSLRRGRDQALRLQCETGGYAGWFEQRDFPRAVGIHVMVAGVFWLLM